MGCLALLALGRGVASAAPVPPDEIKDEITRCDGCHGADGQAREMPASGRIAGQNRDYLTYIIKQYREGRLAGVNAAIMVFAVKQLDDHQIEALARYYAELH